MRRKLTASAVLAVCAAAALGQPPAAGPKKAVDPTGILIEKALAHDPDVAVARAKLALAEAELAKARQAAVARAIALRDTVEAHQVELAALLKLHTLVELSAKRGQGSLAELTASEAKVAAAKATLARAETELKLLTGDGPKFAVDAGTGLRIHVPALGPVPALPPDRDPEFLRALTEMMNAGLAAKAPAGSIPDRLRAALDKRVRLGGGKGVSVSLGEAVATFKKDAGFDVPVRQLPSPSPLITPGDEELPVGAWFQMFQDYGGRPGEGLAFYVREYGILVATRQTAPPDAMTLSEFWRSRPVAAAPPAAKEPERKRPAAKRFEYPHDKAGQAIEVKAGEEVAFVLPVKTADVDVVTAGSDNLAVATRAEDASGVVVVVVRSDRPAKATVVWQLVTVSGQIFRSPGRVTVEFK